MDTYELEEKLRQILEHVSREITDDVLETVIRGQQKHSRQDRLYSSNKLMKTAHYDTKSVATMTEQDWQCASDVKKTTENCSITNKAERGHKKRSAEERKEMNLANKMYKPGECMKYMTVELHPALLSAWYAADVARELGAAGARLRPARALCHPALVLWTRTATDTGLTVDDGLVHLSRARECCARALYVATAEEVAELVAARSLAAALGCAAQLAACHLTLLVFGCHDYFKTTGRKKASNHRPQMTEVELEMALTDLLVSARCDSVKVDAPSDLALAVVHFTKAIAETPHKLAKRQGEESAQFYMRGDSKNCVAVTKTGVGCGKLWQQMLATLPMSSLERARALAARHPSPRRLLQELQSPGGVERVADIGVPRSAVPGSVARRTGVEFARKLAILFTADDGDMLVQ